MKITIAAVTAIAGLVVSSAADAAIVTYKATLNGDQEVPAVATQGAGTAELDFDDAAKTLSGVIETSGLDVTKVNGQHIHKAACGASGSFVKVLTKPGENGVIVLDTADPWQMSDSDVEALNKGELYVNIHTAANPGGEIRGQIFKEGSADTCPTGGAGGDGGATPTDGGGNTSSSGGTTGDGGTAAPPSDDGGCSTSGSSNGSNGLLFALGVGAAVIAASRRSERAKRAKQAKQAKQG